MRTGWVVGLALALLSPSLRAAQSVLPVGTTSQFNSVLDQIKSGALGSKIRSADIEVRRDHVVMRLKLHGNRSENVVLTRPTGETQGTRSRFFSIETSPKTSSTDLSSLAGLLDNSFSTDPWVMVPSPGEAATTRTTSAPPAPAAAP